MFTRLYDGLREFFPLDRVIIEDSLQLAEKYRVRKTEDVYLERLLESVVEICEPFSSLIPNVYAMSLINFEIINNIYWLWQSCTHSNLGACQVRVSYWQGVILTYYKTVCYFVILTR